MVFIYGPKQTNQKYIIQNNFFYVPQKKKFWNDMSVGK